jgi:hypothetical protein
MPIIVARGRQQRQAERDIIDAAREEADMVERWAQRVHARARYRAIARFEADNAVERGRPDHGAERLRAQRQRHETGGDRGRRARG